jgi:hypothetical protein
MSIDKSFSDELLEMTDPKNLEKSYMISAYLRVDHASPNKKASIKLKSFLLDALRGHEVLGKETEVHHQIIDLAQEKLASLKSHRQGLGVFVKVDKDLEGKFKAVFAEVIALSHKPVQWFQICQVFDVDQLILHEELDSKKAFVFELSRTAGQIYSFGADELLKEQTIESEYVADRRTPYAERMTTSNGGFIAQGPERNLKPLNLKYIELLAKKVIQYAEDNLGKADFVLVFLPKAYMDLKDWLTGIIHTKLGAKTYFPEINPENIQQISDIASDYLRKHVLGSRKQLLKTLLTSPKIFAKGWDDVLSALKESRVHKLYFSPRMQKIGFVLNGQLPNTIKDSNSIKINNLKTWLAKMAHDTGAEVHLLKTKYLMGGVPVAELRF